MYEWRLFLYL
jgi:hypothetical protein